MSEWQAGALRQACEISTGFAFKGDKYESSGNLKVVRGENVTVGSLRWDSEKHWNHSTVGLDEYFIEANDIVIGMDGSRVGQNRAKIRAADLPLILAQRVARLRARQGFDQTFVWYQIIVDRFKDYVDAIHTGTSIPHISMGQIGDYEITFPALSEQKAIAAVLSSLDDKIDLLHRQNQTLEAMAATLFRQWFVEEAQEDWEVVKLSEVCSVITKGTTPTTLGHQFVEAGINFVKAESITDSGDFISEKLAQISEETHQFLKRSKIEIGDVLCSIAGTIGRIAIVDESILPANTNQAIAILRVDHAKCLPEFIYLFLKSAEFREMMDGKIVHAVQPNLSLGEIGNSIIKFPSQDVLRRFENTIRPIFDKKKNNSLQIRTLETLRDTLLPKLMSGAVRVVLGA